MGVRGVTERQKSWTRYLTLGVDADGNLHHILARRGHDPDDIVNKTLEINLRSRGHPARNPTFVRLYVLEVGPEGTYGNSTHLNLKEIVRLEPPPPPREWWLVPVKGAFN